VSYVQVVRDLYEAFGRGDVAAVLGVMEPHVEWNEAEGHPYQQVDGQPFVGPDAIMQNVFERLRTEWDAFTVHPRDFCDAGDTVVVEGRCTGTFKATGTTLDAQYCHVFKISNGKLASFQQFIDTAQIQAVMGAL
jgi:ketosteroid isomerase-like protein